MQQDTLEWIMTTYVIKNEKKKRIWYIYCKLKLLAALSFVCLKKKNNNNNNKSKMILY